MEKAKQWEKFTPKEKNQLLSFWIRYYGGKEVDFNSLEEFDVISLTRQDEIFDYITTSLLVYNTIRPSILLQGIKEQKVDELLAGVIKYNEASDSLKRVLTNTRQIILDEVVKAYLDPQKDQQPDVAITTITK